MKKDLMEILACPVCKSPLELKIDEEKNNDVVTGSLFCGKCNHHYHIKENHAKNEIKPRCCKII